MRGFWLGILFTLIACAAVSLAVAGLGLVPVSADARPGPIERTLAGFVRGAAIKRAAPPGSSPVAATPESLAAGAALYRDNCSGCHGTPGNRENLFASSLYPPAPQFLGVSGPKHSHDSDGEVFVTIRDGIRLSGMPTFSHLLKEDEIWKLVTFLQHLQELPPEALHALESKDGAS